MTDASLPREVQEPALSPARATALHEAPEAGIVAGAAAPEVGITLAGQSQWRDVWRQFLSHKGAVTGLGFLIFITLFCALGDWVWRVDPGDLDVRNKDLRPIYTVLWNSEAKVGWAHPLGTDQLGRDGLAQLIAGGQVSLAVGWTAMLLSMLIGTFVGVLAGYYRRLDGLLMRFTDLVLALPLLPLLLLMMMLFRETLKAWFGLEMGTFLLIVAGIGLTSWMHTARIVRGDVLALKEREFVLAARSIGTPPRRMIRRHILPNTLSAIMVSATLGLATAIITESALSFLGLGFPPDFPTWGKLLTDARDRMVDFPERVIWPGLAISLTVLSVNYIGDGLRDAMDPRIRGR